MAQLKKISILLAFMMPITAQAASPSVLGKYGDWTAYSRYDGAQKICYVVAHAKSKSPSNVRHGDIHFLVASWKSGAASEQPSFMADFKLKDSLTTAQVDGQRYGMYVSANEAFIADRNKEIALVNDMRAGSTLRVSAISSRGTNVSYTFSLSGVTAALDKATAGCG